MSIRQRTTGHHVGEASKPTDAAAGRSKHSKVKVYSTFNLNIEAPEPSAALDLVDTHCVHGDMRCNALDFDLLEARTGIT